jgi:formylglycine-generating enzyme required for sulfatase activity/cytochrome oxidase Cu insertion factor (SCO1/SenC/PrrC family)
VTKIAWAACAALVLTLPPVAGTADDMVRIDGGRYRPLYRQPVRDPRRDTVERRGVSVPVAPFEIGRRPVTNAEYLEFVRARPEWRRSKVSRLFADESYLRHWRGDLDLGPGAPPSSPVVHVSWFAARAFSAAHGRRLPTVAAWEPAAAADETRRDATGDAAFLERVRQWYAQPAPAVLPAVGRGVRNAWGVQDMHGLVWEWTLDFNSALVSGESRGDASLEGSLYCGSGATSAADFSDYAAFMRYAFRSSLEARYTTSSLGFRTARDVRGRGHRGVDGPPVADAADHDSLFELAFPLTDAAGRTRHLADLRGTRFVASMFYTSCTSVCPRVTADLRAIEKALPEADRTRTRFVLFSLDPERDTPAALRRFAADHSLDLARWTLLAARPDDMRTLAAVLGVQFRPDQGGEIAHSAVIAVVDSGGVVRRRQTGLQNDVTPLVTAIRTAR